MPLLKTIGRSGQITLGKEYAGCQVIIDQPEPGVWIIKTGRFIPDSEQWLHAGEASEKLRKAVSWAEKSPPCESNIEELARKMKID